MSILGGYFKTFLVFLCISIETQHRDKIPQLRLITVYESVYVRRSVCPSVGNQIFSRSWTPPAQIRRCLWVITCVDLSVNLSVCLSVCLSVGTSLI